MRRDEGRRRLRRLVAVLVVSLAVAAVAAATRTPLLDVDAVEVRGARRLSVDAVRDALAAADVTAGEALLDVDEGAAARAVEALPLVARARVTTHWPGTVIVAIEERQPVAAVAAGSGVAVVAADGVVLEVVSSAPASLPVLAGLRVDPEPGAVAAGGDVLAVAAALPANVAPGVDAVVDAGGDEVELRLADGVVVRLGSAADLEAKVTALVTVLDATDPACVAIVDVRVPAAPAITPAEGCTP